MKTLRFWAQFIRRVTCFLFGHRCELTGRHAIYLHEMKCKRCEGLYIAHSLYPGVLTSADSGSDRILRDCMDAIKAEQACPSRKAPVISVH